MTTAGGTAAPRRRYGLFLVPLAFAALAVLLYGGLLRGDASTVPSVLIGHPVPAFSLPPVEGLTRDGKPVPGLASTDLQAGGGVTVVNVFASWCGPCREEHPALMALERAGKARIVGINNKDRPENARAFLAELGNPYSAVGADANNRASIEWGVYGVPETFVVGKDGRIFKKFVGPIASEQRFAELILAINEAGEQDTR